MATRPTLQRDPRFADVQSGASSSTGVQVGGPSFSDVQGGASSSSMQEYAPGVRYSDSGHTAGDATALAGFRQSSYGASNLRPLLQGNSDGSPMSSADMESRQNAMGALDEFFTNAPARQQLQESEGAARLRQSEALAQDPLYKERELSQLQFDQKDALSQLGEMRRQRVMSNYADQLEQLGKYYDDLQAKTPPGPELEALKAERAAEEEKVGKRFGFMGNDERNVLYKPR